MVEQAVRTEVEGFSSLWYPSAVARRPARRDGARRARDDHPGAGHRGAADVHVASGADGEPRPRRGQRRWGATDSRSASARRTRSVIEGSFGISYANAGRHTEEYVTILTQLLHGEAVEFRGDDFDVRLGAPAHRRRRHRAGARRRARTPSAAGRGCGRRRHHPLDGQRARRRDARGPAHPGGRRRRRSRRAAHRGRAPGRRARQRRRGA